MEAQNDEKVDASYDEFIQVLSSRNLGAGEEKTPPAVTVTPPAATKTPAAVTNIDPTMASVVVTVTNSTVAGVVNQLTLSGPEELKKSLISAAQSGSGMDLNENRGKDGIVSGKIPLYQLLSLIKSNGYSLCQVMPSGKGSGGAAHDKYVFEKNKIN